MSNQTHVDCVNMKSVVNESTNGYNNSQSSLEQIRYANVIQICSWTGICLIGITFLLYISGIFQAFINPSTMPNYWEMNVHQYLQATHSLPGWNWLGMLNYGDYLNYIGLAFLGLVTILSYISILTIYLRKKDYSYLAIVSLEIVVLILAASGIFKVSAG